MLHNDLQALDELIAPELLFTGLNGQLATKEDDLASHRANLLQLMEIEPFQQQVQIYSDFAIVSALMHLVGSYAGEPIDQQIRYTRVWVVRPDGSMQIVAGHMSEVQP